MQILDERWRELTHREHALFEHLVEFLHRERASTCGSSTTGVRR
jgi:DNA replication initiation complex subunit (GINS family)